MNKMNGAVTRGKPGPTHLVFAAGAAGGALGAGRDGEGQLVCGGANQAVDVAPLGAGDALGGVRAPAGVAGGGAGAAGGVGEIVAAAGHVGVGAREALAALQWGWASRGVRVASAGAATLTGHGLTQLVCRRWRSTICCRHCRDAQGMNTRCAPRRWQWREDRHRPRPKFAWTWRARWGLIRWKRGGLGLVLHHTRGNRMRLTPLCMCRQPLARGTGAVSAPDSRYV